MKRIVVLLVFTFAELFGQISWTRVHPKLQDQIQDVVAINSQIVVAVGSNGGLFSTSNGGTTWNTAGAASNSNYYDVDFAGGFLCAVGTNGTVAVSRDSANSWTILNDTTIVGDIMAVDFINSADGWIGGQNGVIYHTTNQGTTWSVQNPATLSSAAFIRDIYFVNASKGFVAGTNGTYGYTTDGGATWNISEASVNFQGKIFFDIEFTDVSNGWMLGTSDAIRSTDGGSNWNVTGLPTVAFGGIMYDMDLAAANTWFISGENGIVAKTTDAGGNWTYTTVGNGSFNLYGCSFANADTGWVVGDGGVIYKTTDGGTNWTSQIATVTREYLNGAHFFDRNNGIVVGNSGTMIRTYNGGVSWTNESSKLNTSYDLYDIYFPSDTVGYICGNQVFFSTMDGGATWTKTDFNETLNKVKFLDEDIGWVVGGNGEMGYIAKTTNRGVNWTSYTANNIYSINDLDIITANILVAVGVNGGIYRTQDGGETWGPITSNTITPFSSVDFEDDGKTGFAASSEMHVFKTTNAGLTWDSTNARITITNPISDLIIVNPTNIYCVGDNGSVYYTTDEGQMWSDMSDNMTSFGYSKIIAMDRSHFWRVGGGGNVHYGVDNTAGQPPAPSYNVYPISGDIDIPLTPQLRWEDSGAAAPDGFRIYFGTDGSGSILPTDIENGTDLGNLTTYTVASNLDTGRTYYWAIVPYNANGEPSVNHIPIWSFKTRSSYEFGGGGLSAPGYFFVNSTPAAAASSLQQPTYSWVDTSGMTAIRNWSSGNRDDGYFGPINLGFQFPFFGINYSQLYISSNGAITFGSGYSGTGASASLPSTSAPNNLIAGLMMDLDSVNAKSQVYYGIFGNAFYATWYHYGPKSNPSDDITFQMILHSDGSIVFQYNDLESTFPLPASIGNDALIGIENKWGTKGVEYRNNGVGGSVFGSPVAVSFGAGNGGALPVELTTFTALKHGKDVILNWETATEVNNYGYEITRIGGKSHNWEKIGFVPGSGNSNSPKSYSFVDNDPAVANKTKIRYKLKQIDINGDFEYSDIVEVDFTNENSKFFLSQNTPNPFNPSTKIKFSIPKGNSANHTTVLRIYDVLGRLVKTLINDKLEAGEYEVEFNAENLSSGIYFYSLTSGNHQSIRKMVLVK